MNLSTQKEAKAQVEEVLHTSPRRHGIKRSRWRLQDLGQVIPWLQGCSLPGVSQILKRLKIGIKQAISFVHSPDPDYGLKRRRMANIYISGLNHPASTVVLFHDELSYYQQPDRTPIYGPVGPKPPRVYRAGIGNTLTRAGAMMNGVTGQVDYIQGNKFGRLAMARLYRLVRSSYPDRRIFVIQDNCNFHYDSMVLATAEKLDIHPVYLPTYASWLNPIEKLWRWLKADVLHGHEFGHDLRRLRQVVAEFLDQFANGSDDLLHYVGLLPD